MITCEVCETIITDKLILECPSCKNKLSLNFEVKKQSEQLLRDLNKAKVPNKGLNPRRSNR